MEIVDGVELFDFVIGVSLTDEKVLRYICQKMVKSLNELHK